MQYILKVLLKMEIQIFSRPFTKSSWLSIAAVTAVIVIVAFVTNHFGKKAKSGSQSYAVIM